MSDITTGNFVCIEQTPATIGDRIFARIIDAVVLVAYTYFALFFLDKSGIGDDTFFEVLCVIILLMPIFTYTFLSELLFDGQTLGKYVMKTRVVMADGSSPTSGALLLRFVCEIVDIYMGCMGLVVIMCTKRLSVSATLPPVRWLFGRRICRVCASLSASSTMPAATFVPPTPQPQS